jgi:sulfur carrier protein
VNVVANGRSVEVPDGATVATVLDALGLGGRVVVVEKNGEPIARGDVAHVTVRAGDRLEIVRAVAGG